MSTIQLWTLVFVVLTFLMLSCFAFVVFAVSAVSAVPPVRSTPGHVPLSAEMHGPIAAVAGANLYDRLVDESALHDSSGFDADELSPLFLVE